jgi:hypothetical protein
MNDDSKKTKGDLALDLINDIFGHVDSLHAKMMNRTELLGIAREQLLGARPIFEWYKSREAHGDLSATTYLHTTIGSLSALRNEVMAVEKQAEPLVTAIDGITPSINVSVSTPGSMARFIATAGTEDGATVPPPPAFLLPPLTRPDLPERLCRLDATLGDVCRQIRQTLYGTRADPTRSAMYLTRQVFDHLFNKLAPDDDVREHLGQLPGEQVTRKQRVHYAIDKHVGDSGRKATLHASVDEFVAWYEELQKAHTRGPLDENAARTTLVAMNQRLEEWAEALKL